MEFILGHSFLLGGTDRNNISGPFMRWISMYSSCIQCKLSSCSCSTGAASASACNGKLRLLDDVQRNHQTCVLKTGRFLALFLFYFLPGPTDELRSSENLVGLFASEHLAQDTGHEKKVRAGSSTIKSVPGVAIVLLVIASKCW